MFNISSGGLPHARGGVSGSKTLTGFGTKSSPRPWGCFFGDMADAAEDHVFPTPVGVFPAGPSVHRHGLCLPHARGGVSLSCGERALPTESSPRPWGCFRDQPWWENGNPVFPTPVGVFLKWT